MQELLKFTLFRADESSLYRKENASHLNAQLFSECITRWPQFLIPNGAAIVVKGAMDNPTVAEVISFMRETGREPQSSRFPSLSPDHPTMYRAEGERAFDPEDITKAEYFWCVPVNPIMDVPTTEEGGLLRIRRSEIKRQRIGNPYGDFTSVCVESLRREFDIERFIGLIYRPVTVEGKKPPVEPLWQIWSDRLMPPMLNRVIGDDGTDFAPDKRYGAYVDDFYFPYLLRFHGRQVRSMEPFDVALTAEHFGQKPGPYYEGNWLRKLDPYLITSRRFKDWCDKRKLKMHWWPVSLE